MSASRRRETWQDVWNYVEERLKAGITDMSDWRPASDMYIDDIAKIASYNGEQYVTVPGGVRIWLENGDSIIYIKKQEDSNDDS